MFKKLISNLPFNPSLIGQVSFYARRLHKEERLRRLGLIFMVLSLIVQMFAVASPPERSLAASANDIIYGGVQTTGDLVDAYMRNAGGDVQAIFAHYGVGTSELAQAQDSSVDTRGDNVNRYYSIGRTIGSRSDSFEVAIPGSSTPIYMRTLGGWAEKVWPAFSLPSSKYGRVWILKDCGNIVTEGIPPTGNPALEIFKTAEPGHNSTVLPGDKVHYTLTFSNKGQAPATNFRIEDTIPDQLHNIEIGESGAFEYVSGSTFRAYWDAEGRPSILGNHPTLQYQVNFWATVRLDAGPGRFCNQANISSDGSSAVSNEVCHEIPPCPYNPGLPPNHPGCQAPVMPVATASCTLLNARFLSRTEVEFEAIASSTEGAVIQSFEFNSGVPGGALNIPVNETGNVSRKFTYDYPGSPAPATYNASVVAVTSLGNQSSDSCQRVIEIEEEKLPLVTAEKSVLGAGDQKVSQINSRPGDEFTFVFTIRNVGDAAAENYVMPEDNITDVLEYAELINPNEATVVKRDSNLGTVLQWTPFNVNPGETLEKKVNFKLKEILPKTNTPAGNTQSFDCRIQNSIDSSTVIVDIDKSYCLVKVVEQTTTRLPNTGPGTTVATAVGLTVIISYFFARVRLLAKETDIVRSEYLTSGAQ